MKQIALVSIFMIFALTACSEPMVPKVDSPDLGSYGQTIKPDHKVPEEHRN